MASGLFFSPQLEVGQHEPQQELASTPYDRWLSPTGAVAAEFHRHPQGFLLRFPQQADFIVSADLEQVCCKPVPGLPENTITSLFNNAVLPLLANHAGGLNLHGSAVVVNDVAVAFLGHSRSGKTTLASAFARAGHPFLTEDVVDLTAGRDGFTVRPGRPVVRLFADSADHLGLQAGAAAAKQEIAVSQALPIADGPAPLGAIFVLGDSSAGDVLIEPLAGAAAAARLLPHAFVLDVTDRARLQGHFERMIGLATAVPCHGLDYPRNYKHLPAVLATVKAVVMRQDNG